MGTFFQKVACKLLVAYIGKAVPVYVQARNLTYATPQHAAVDFVVVVALLFYVHGKHLRSCRDGQLT